MKVIKKGTRKRKAFWSKKFKCKGIDEDFVCGAILLVTQNDIYFTLGTKNAFSVVGMDEPHYFATFCCPECGAETEVNVPENIEFFGKRPTKRERRKLQKNFNDAG